MSLASFIFSQLSLIHHSEFLYIPGERDSSIRAWNNVIRILSRVATSNVNELIYLSARARY